MLNDMCQSGSRPIMAELYCLASLHLDRACIPHSTWGARAGGCARE